MVQAPGTLLRGPGVAPRKNVEIVYAKYCNMVRFWPENGSHCRPYCVLTTGTPFPSGPVAFQPCDRRSHAFPHRNDARLDAKRFSLFSQRKRRRWSCRCSRPLSRRNTWSARTWFPRSSFLSSRRPEFQRRASPGAIRG